MKKLWYLSMIASSFIACEQSEQKNETHPEVVFDGISEQIAPGDDFYNHVNKNWYDNAVIADDQVGVGAYRFLNIPQQELLKNILEEVSEQSHDQGSVEQLVGDFYASGMDTLSIDKRGITPIQALLEKIDGTSTTEQLMDVVANQIKTGDYSFLAPYISPDQKNSKLNILHLAQTGLGLPDRNYYFNEDPSSVAIQDAYKTYLTTLFELVGDPEAAANAAIVYAIEKELADSHKTRIQRRVIKDNYNKVSVIDLDNGHNQIDWQHIFTTLGTDIDSLNVRQPAYYDKVNDVLASTALKDLKLYVKAKSLSNHDNILSTPFEDASFAYTKVISGQSEQQSRTKRMVRNVDRQIGFALGQLYVKRYFNEEAKERALDLVNNFQKSLEQRIENLEWMSDSTKVKAKEKLFAINKKIGYPDVWRTYDVEINRDQFFENVVALRNDSYQYELKQLNKAPNRDEWGTTPSTVTAYYNPSLNEIVFPAGILQAPYFDLYADDAVNYGGIGMVIGHEFTHAFDDQGAQYDKEGNVKNWWTEEDYTKFKAKTQQIIEQYDSFTVLDSVHLKGALTVGENTADNGGISIAYDAFKRTKQGQDTTRIGGFTPDQRFFLSVARIWRVKTRDEYLRNYVATDPHSPPIWRVNGPLMNFTPFYEAFDVKEGQKNFKTPEERIKIW
ncbi:M13 family metallopeptidase [Dokdonia donghaensis]|uniref:Peptidase M13 n=1 Tax=Dokdonia donghaensis DSW-1 TaxID=1300343 RepID=A0A0A2GZ72_9FLAO|nr:M13 family metallopeptidase [Dokdonia donghaensis]ANH61043.1 Neutral endopeptidase [Dokdonia donghaensis DSW-1]KGO05730.1 peptidase M13 [Dokdonia donghaensis DSW-1]